MAAPLPLEYSSGAPGKAVSGHGDISRGAAGPAGAAPEGQSALRRRALAQAARTLLLAQASDWPFLMRAGTAREAAREGLEGLFGRLDALCASLESGRIDRALLEACERRDPAFADLDPAFADLDPAFADLDPACLPPGAG